MILTIKIGWEYGFRERENIQAEEIGTYIPFAQIDSDLVHVNQMLKFVKFGFGQCMDHACYDLRDGLIDRKTAIELVLRYDGKCAEKYIDEFCNYLQISKNEFLETMEKFRGDIWYEKDGILINKLHEQLKSELESLL